MPTKKKVKKERKNDIPYVALYFNYHIQYTIQLLIFICIPSIFKLISFCPTPRLLSSEIMIKILNWRNVYLLTIPLRIVLALSNSYIHPDEHFQSLEVLSARILGYETNIPWEFDPTSPARSLAPLYLVYGPLLYLIKLLGLSLTPLQIWYLLRLQMCIISWVVTDLCLYWMLPSKHERIKAIYFTLTSYITFVYQNHLFSNSVETILLLLAVYIIDDLRYIEESKINVEKSKTLFWFGILISIGVFNRVTFPAFLILPSWYLLKYFQKHVKLIIWFLLGVGLLTILLVVTDTILYNSDTFVVAPINNLLYNAQISNLSKHGIHPFYTHVLVNLPQLLGPAGLLFLVSKQYSRTTQFLTIISGLIFLSVVPHQEARFLIPLVPLLCCCFDLNQKWIGSWTLYLWYLFNVAMCILMGVYHQGGVVPALDYMRQLELHGTQVWWLTYSPPSWILGSNSTHTILLKDKKIDYRTNYTIIDAMGSNLTVIMQTIQHLEKPVYLITPEASFKQHFFNTSAQFENIWSYKHHIDLDHIDWSNLQVGLGIYQSI